MTGGRAHVSRAVRLAALGLSHEANTFAPHRVDTSTSDAAVLRGSDIVAVHQGGETTMAGFLAVRDGPDVAVVPLVMTALSPAGVITAEALRIRADDLVATLDEEGPFDGVLAALHGAAVAEDIFDVDGYLLRRIRDVVGPDVPIGVSLDLHANISAEMVAHSTVLNTYRTNPHVDAKDVAEEVARLIIRTARGEVVPTQAFQPIPVALNILSQNTASSPMREIMAEVRATMAKPGVLSATVAEGFPYADVPEMGMAVVVVTDNAPVDAARFASALAENVWARRELFPTGSVSVEDAIRRAVNAPQGPVLLLDVGDNVGGGGPGDSVILLSCAREQGLESVLTVVADPAAVAQCDRRGPGAEVDLSIGGKSSRAAGEPVKAKATMLVSHDGLFDATETVHAGVRRFDGGRTAAVRLETGQTVILTSKAVPPWSIAQLTSIGLHPADFKAIIAKGVNSPLAAYGPYVSEVLHVNTPGVTSADLSCFAYRHRRRPLFPFESEATLFPPDADRRASLESGRST